MNFSCIQHSSITLGSAFICLKFLIFSISHFLIFSFSPDSCLSPGHSPALSAN